MPQVRSIKKSAVIGGFGKKVSLSYAGQRLKAAVTSLRRLASITKDKKGIVPASAVVIHLTGSQRAFTPRFNVVIRYTM